MELKTLLDRDLKKDEKLYIKGIRLVNTVKVDYRTQKHVSFLVQGDNELHNVMYFDEKPDDRKWQCDCKWYTLHNKICSHITAANLAVREKKISLD